MLQAFTSPAAPPVQVIADADLVRLQAVAERVWTDRHVASVEDAAGRAWLVMIAPDPVAPGLLVQATLRRGEGRALCAYATVAELTMADAKARPVAVAGALAAVAGVVQPPAGAGAGA